MKRISCVLLFVMLNFQVLGGLSLLIDGEDVSTATIELGLSYEIMVVSNDSTQYEAFVGFDDGMVLGNFEHVETTIEAGDLADARTHNTPDFSGYYLRTDFLNTPTTSGVHHIFEYSAETISATTLKLYDRQSGDELDSIKIVVVPEKNRAIFSYQGRLNDSGDPANGMYDFKFTLFDQNDPEIATQQGDALEVGMIEVSDGYFQTELYFGEEVFNGDTRWLEIGVRPSTDSTDPNDLIYETLSPRVGVKPGPYAIHSASAENARKLNGKTSDAFADAGHSHGSEYIAHEYAESLEARITQLETALSQQNETIGKLYELLDGVTRDANDIVFSGVNVHVVSGSGQTDGPVNGLGNLIVGYNELRRENNDRSGSHNIVLGNMNNYSSYGGFVAGNMNNIIGPFSTVSGGIGNFAVGDYTSVTGGTGNRAESSVAVVTGGYGNAASGYASVVIGGSGNGALFDYGVAAGGRDNKAQGFWSTVMGGMNNSANGNYSSVGGGKDETVDGEYDWRAGNDYFADE